MALLGLLLDLQRIHKWNLLVWHGDHAWHQKSQSIASELKNWCQSKNISFFLDRAMYEETKNESMAREWRYKCLELCVNNLSLPKNIENCKDKNLQGY